MDCVVRGVSKSQTRLSYFHLEGEFGGLAVCSPGTLGHGKPGALLARAEQKRVVLWEAKGPGYMQDGSGCGPGVSEAPRDPARGPGLHAAR